MYGLPLVLKTRPLGVHLGDLGMGWWQAVPRKESKLPFWIDTVWQTLWAPASITLAFTMPMDIIALLAPVILWLRSGSGCRSGLNLLMGGGQKCWDITTTHPISTSDWQDPSFLTPGGPQRD